VGNQTPVGLRCERQTPVVPKGASLGTTVWEIEIWIEKIAENVCVGRYGGKDFIDTNLKQPRGGTKPIAASAKGKDGDN